MSDRPPRFVERYLRVKLEQMTNWFRRVRYRWILLVLGAVAVVVVAVTLYGNVTTSARAGPTRSLLSLVNEARNDAGKAPVELYWDLTDDAKRHAAAMAANQSVYGYDGIGSATSVRWKSIVQLVGAGASAEGLFDAWMASNRSIILGSFNYVGVGIVVDEADVVWAAMFFMLADDGLNDPPTTTTVVPATSPVTTTPATSPVTTTPVTTAAPVTSPPASTSPPSAVTSTTVPPTCQETNP